MHPHRSQSKKGSANSFLAEKQRAICTGCPQCLSPGQIPLSEPLSLPVSLLGSGMAQWLETWV